MIWLRLPLALSLLWAIWFLLPVQSWTIAGDVRVIRSASELTVLPAGSKLLLEGTLWPQGAVQHLYDGAFLYERKVHHKSWNSAVQNDIFEAQKPASLLRFADGSELHLPAGHYRPIARHERHRSTQPLHDLTLPSAATHTPASPRAGGSSAQNKYNNRLPRPPARRP